MQLAELTPSNQKSLFLPEFSHPSELCINLYPPTSLFDIPSTSLSYYAEYVGYDYSPYTEID